MTACAVPVYQIVGAAAGDVLSARFEKCCFCGEWIWICDGYCPQSKRQVRT